MKYFKSISSLSELKKQFRELVLANHPDKGGSTEAMQEINSEFEVLFNIWKDRSIKCGETVDKKETASSYRSEFYTQNGWKGENYNLDMDTTEISKRIRLYVKEKYPTCTFSVLTSYFSGGSSISVYLMSANFAAIKENCTEKYLQVNHFYVEEDTRLTERAIAVMVDVNEYIKSFNFSDCDGMIDYFHVNFYYDLSVGKWDKPFTINNKKDVLLESNKKEAKKQPPKNIPPASSSFELVDYSEKAIALFGDTREIKDQLKEIGGRFNPYLTKNGSKSPGWIFSKSKADKVRELINNSAA